jgi:hypothetical protein
MGYLCAGLTWGINRPTALDTISISRWLTFFAGNLGTSFPHLWAISYHKHFSGARSPNVTCSKSRKSCIYTCICYISSTSSSISYFSSIVTGSLVLLSDVTPVVVPSTNESPGIVLALLLYTNTKVMHSFFFSKRCHYQLIQKCL